MPARFRMARFLMRIVDRKRLRLIETQERQRAIDDAHFAEQTQELSFLVKKLPQKAEELPMTSEILTLSKTDEVVVENGAGK